jgi:hypothetical protein
MFDGEYPDRYQSKVLLWVGQKVWGDMMILSLLTFSAHEKLVGDHAADRLPHEFRSKSEVLSARWFVLEGYSSDGTN